MSQTALQTDLRSEYEAIRQGVGVIEFLRPGILQISGKNAAQFLNGLVSNDVKALQPGQGVLAAFPNLQGKLLALCRVYNTGDHFLMELDQINREKIFKNLSRFVPAGEFFITDVSDQTTLISLQGPRAKDLIEALTGKSINNLALYQIQEMEVSQTVVLIAAHSRLGEAGFDLFVPIDAAPQLRESILAQGQSYGAHIVSEPAYEVARIEAGVPREGVDAGENYIILESELNDAVSYTKGCYLGQEVIARIHWRGQPAKRLRRLIVESDQLPPAGAWLYANDGKKVGEITSSAQSFDGNGMIALGYVHRHHLNPGTEFVVKQGENEIGRAKLVAST